METQSLFIVGEARTNVENAITKIYGSFYMVFEIDPLTDKIMDMNCTHSLDLTERFIQKIFIGKSITADLPVIERELNRRYYGSSEKAIVASMKDASKKYLAAKAKL
jgi:beta-lactamase class A